MFNSLLRRFSCLVVLSLFGSWTASAEGRAPWSITPVERAGSSVAEVSRGIEVDLGALRDGEEALRLEMPDGLSFEVRRTQFERRGDGEVTWRGVFEDGTGRVVLTVSSGFVVGRIQTPTSLYVVEPTRDGRQRIERVDPDRYAECAEGERVELAGGPQPDFFEAVDPPDSIDVMALYSPQARSGAGGQAQIEATIQAAVDNANTAFADSQMTARFVLVHAEETSRNEVGGDLSADLSWVRNDAGVGALRDEHAADMVALIVESSSFCGRGYVMQNPGPGFEDAAFQVTVRVCAVGNLSYAHEHGHNMGFEHDPANGSSPSNASYPWSFGHYVNGSYRTVMSYSSQCSSGCTRVAHFSNPDVLHSGVATGIANQRDNARSGDLTAPIVTDFRLRTTSECGNGVLESGEECDGGDLGGATCSSQGCASGTPSCTASCTLDYSTCSDCPVCDFDGVCEVDEDCVSCAADCVSGSGATCGNGVCEIADGENCVTCAADCAGKQNGKPSGRFCCGNGGQNPVGCADVRCNSGGFSCTTDAGTPSCCGDLVCEGIEDSFNCALDCGAPPTCGDGTCDPGEDMCGCAVDCGTPPLFETSCTDGDDNDCDGLVDCADADCDTDPACDLTCLPKNASCSLDEECCSGVCKNNGRCR